VRSRPRAEPWHHHAASGTVMSFSISFGALTSPWNAEALTTNHPRAVGYTSASHFIKEFRGAFGNRVTGQPANGFVARFLVPSVPRLVTTLPRVE
jgi:hypothetical protein